MRITECVKSENKDEKKDGTASVTARTPFRDWNSAAQSLLFCRLPRFHFPANIICLRFTSQLNLFGAFIKIQEETWQSR